MPIQLSHSTTTFNSNTFDIIIICDGIQSPANVGALFRISDAMGVKEIIFCNGNINFSSNRLHRTARNTVKSVAYKVSKDICSEINNLLEIGYYTIALEITSDSVPLQNLKPKSKKIALIIGNEKNGVSPTVLSLVKQSTHIEMHGKNSSMNVIQATSIALFSLTKL